MNDDIPGVRISDFIRTSEWYIEKARNEPDPQFRRLYLEIASYYNKGDIVDRLGAEKVEVIMGDKFENISNSTIVNRSSLNNALNRIGNEQNPEIVEALERIAQMVESSKDTDAVENFNAFTEELQKTEPKKSILKSLWGGLTIALPTILKMTDVADKINTLIQHIH